MASSSPLQVQPGRGIGLFLLGTSVFDILNYIKMRSNEFPVVEEVFSQVDPVGTPLVFNLPKNGIRLRFDGPDQRLRLVEIVDFSKVALTYQQKDLVKLQDTSVVGGFSSQKSNGPNFRHVYNLCGPAFPGEYLAPPSTEDSNAKGMYVLSYSGLAFSFPFQASAWSPKVDFVSLMSSSAASPAVSMAVFEGESWPQARTDLFTRTPSFPRSLALSSGRSRDSIPDEIEMVKVWGEGRIQLTRRSGSSFWIILSETTPEDLVTELGPPDAIYRGSDGRLSSHPAGPKRSSSDASRRTSRSYGSTDDDSNDAADRTSNYTDTDESDDADDASAAAEDIIATTKAARNESSKECFYNYFSHGLDVFISAPKHNQSPPLPVQTQHDAIIYDSSNDQQATDKPDLPTSSRHQTATKIILHGNIPGSYPFNRYRRCRWTLEHATTPATNAPPPNAEMKFATISATLKEYFKGQYADAEEERSQQRGMVLNRGWRDSPGSSCELLGGWEEGASLQRKGLQGSRGGSDLGNSELYGFPGLVFEVLKSGAICNLTVY